MAVQPSLCVTWSETLKTGFLTRRLIYGTLFNISHHSKRSVEKKLGFAKLPVLSVHPECVDYVPLHTLKEHPLWNVLNNINIFGVLIYFQEKN